MLNKKCVAFLLTLVMLLSMIPLAYASSLDVKSQSAILIDAYSGNVLYEKDANKRVAPASVTKLMTLLVAMEAILDEKRATFEDIVVTSENAWRLGGSQIYLEPGEEMSMQDMLISIAVGSANDACVAVAEHLYGSQEAFVNKMNEKAANLGLTNTHFANPYGLDEENHYTSAYDMAKISREALKYPEIQKLVTIKHYKIRTETDKPFQLDNTNKMLWWYEGTDGFKTGWTSKAGYCLASTVKRKDLRLIAVTFGNPERRGNFRDSMAIYNWGFAQYSFKQFHDQGEVLGKVKVGKGKQDYVEAVTEKKVGQTNEKGSKKELTTKVELSNYIEAPVVKGQVIGKVNILEDGQVIDQINLVAKEKVEKCTLWPQIKKSFTRIFS